MSCPHPSNPTGTSSIDTLSLYVVLQGQGCEVSNEDLQQQKWTKLISDHKQLTEMMHNLMEISLALSVLASLRVIPSKLLEEPTLRSFQPGWLKALGDLARYHMAMAAMVTNNQLKGLALTTDAVSKVAVASADGELVTAKSKSQMSVKSSSDCPAVQVNDLPSPSIGVVAAHMMDVEPEKQLLHGLS
ncbi:hypothetical protein EDB19DRAFT_1826344 [Suillus lakei]|nr:hypothetical protein EDB19DRAFT_1826344 [Suillus lakei]